MCRLPDGMSPEEYEAQMERDNPDCAWIGGRFLPVDRAPKCPQRRKAVYAGERYLVLECGHHYLLHEDSFGKLPFVNCYFCSQGK